MLSFSLPHYIYIATRYWYYGAVIIIAIDVIITPLPLLRHWYYVTRHRAPYILHYCCRHYHYCCAITLRHCCHWRHYWYYYAILRHWPLLLLFIITFIIIILLFITITFIRSIIVIIDGLLFIISLLFDTPLSLRYIIVDWGWYCCLRWHYAIMVVAVIADMLPPLLPLVIDIMALYCHCLAMILLRHYCYYSITLPYYIRHIHWYYYCHFHTIILLHIINIAAIIIVDYLQPLSLLRHAIIIIFCLLSLLRYITSLLLLPLLLSLILYWRLLLRYYVVITPYWYCRYAILRYCYIDIIIIILR